MKFLFIPILAQIIFASITTTHSKPHGTKPVSGYADLHVHMFSNLGFAGGWFLGDPNVSEYEKIFNFCKNESKPSVFKKWITKISPYFGSFLFREDCVSKTEFFPTWNDLAHQQVWKGHLKKAHEDGLSLVIISAVHSYLLCNILPDSRKKFEDCEDRPNIVRQLQAANEWANIEKAWVQIAKTPEEARQIINSGKLAVILSVETENIFDHADWEEEFKEYWNYGVRTLQIVHQFDNKLAGAAIHQRPLIYGQYLRNWIRHHELKSFDSTTVSYNTSFGMRTIKKNKKGLTDFGKTILKLMMEHGMTIDFAHMSEKSAFEVIDIIKNNNYPFYISHGHFRDIMLSDTYGSYEKSSSVEVLNELKKVDGIFGLRTFETGTHHHNVNVPNNCDGSSLSFAQAYSFGRDLGINIALGSDFNGFIPQTKPRFSTKDPLYCSSQTIPKLNLPFDYTGLGRVDQLGSLLLDLNQTGIDLENLKNSAEKYIQVWEKSILASKKLATIP